MIDDLVRRRLEIFPLSTQIREQDGGSQLEIAGCSLTALAEEYGTPLYLFDCSTLDACVHDYREALRRSYAGQSAITYAGKAYLCTALVQWAQRHELWLDCTGANEIAIARAGGAPRERILVHGVNKSQVDLQAAVEHAKVLVVDNLPELKHLIELEKGTAGPFPDLWLRLRPGLAVDTHAYTQTGQEDSKFGMDLQDAELAVETCPVEGLPLTGLHFHLGSHFHDPAPLAPALEQTLDFCVHLQSRLGWLPQVLCPGGGWSVAYHEADLPLAGVEQYVGFIAGHIQAGCNAKGLPLPQLQLEPGRSLVARAAVSIYRLGTVKHTPHRRWLLLDGGIADNIRPALYGARYTALPVEKLERPFAGGAWMGGPYCESGDVLIEDLPMPEMQPGELIAVPASGAYQLSMSSNYNGALKPAVIWLDEGQARLIQARQDLQDLLRRDLPLT